MSNEALMGLKWFPSARILFAGRIKACYRVVEIWFLLQAMQQVHTKNMIDSSVISKLAKISGVCWMMKTN